MARRLAFTLAVATLLLFVVRLFFLREYPVRSASMAPAVHGAEEGGELVLVAFGRGRRIQRFDLVVVRVDGRREPILKRVGGLPGESVEIQDGDLLIDGRRLPPDALRPAPVLVFDDRLQDLSTWFLMGATGRNPWTRENGEWALDARSVPRGSNAGMMFLGRDLMDGYVESDGTAVPGRFKVHDAIVGCEILLGDSPAVFRLGLHEKGDTFEVQLAEEEPGLFAARLVRRNAHAAGEVLDATALPYEPDRWLALRFSNVDDHLSFRVDGREVLSASYDGNVAHPSEVREGTLLWRSYGHRVSLGGEAGRARVRRVRVWRDLHYTAQGEHAVRAPLQLGSDEIFVLGDNSSASTDGRMWGPNRLDSVLGRPLLVVWPPSRVRRLAGAELLP